MEVFGDIERGLSDLYPYRWLIAAVLVACAVALVAFAWKRGWHRAVARNPVRTAVIAIPACAVLFAAGWYTLSPLWQRSYLEEASPLEAASMPTPAARSPTAPATAPPASTTAEPTAAVFPRRTHAGSFVGADDFHFGRGTVQLIETAPGTYTLRVEDFSVRNGPDLFVYLTPDPSGESIDGAINLGELKATDGAFNYEIPPGTDVAQYANAIVWCRQFATLFAVSALSEV